MAQQDTYLTTEGLRALEEELDQLRSVRRPEMAERIQNTKDVGELENEETKSEQGFVEGRIQDLESMIQHAIIIPDHSRAKSKSDVVELGSIVKVQQ
ncbi:MAG: transcription elongation factor GreA, partial [Chloroflexi bacterium]|nr:transcription elongation factor GreA [Chloroflexota bacterium]